MDVEKRSLTRLLRCHKCKSYMVGYRNKKEDLHYYRCHHCAGVSLNAQTTPHALRKGANHLFADLLDRYRLPKEITPMVELQLKKMFHHFNANLSGNDTALKKELAVNEKKIKQLKIRHGLREIDKETYDLTVAHLNDRMHELHKELGKAIPQLSNLEKLLELSIAKLAKLNAVWRSSTLDDKRRYFLKDLSSMRKITFV